MRFILGMIVGALLVSGLAYLHDTGMMPVGPVTPFVNWDTVFALAGR